MDANFTESRRLLGSNEFQLIS